MVRYVRLYQVMSGYVRLCRVMSLIYVSNKRVVVGSDLVYIRRILFVMFVSALSFLDINLLPNCLRTVAYLFCMIYDDLYNIV